MAGHTMPSTSTPSTCLPLSSLPEASIPEGRCVEHGHPQSSWETGLVPDARTSLSLSHAGASAAGAPQHAPLQGGAVHRRTWSTPMGQVTTLSRNPLSALPPSASQPPSHSTSALSPHPAHTLTPIGLPPLGPSRLHAPSHSLPLHAPSHPLPPSLKPSLKLVPSSPALAPASPSDTSPPLAASPLPSPAHTPATPTSAPTPSATAAATAVAAAVADSDSTHAPPQPPFHASVAGAPPAMLVHDPPVHHTSAFASAAGASAAAAAAAEISGCSGAAGDVQPARSYASPLQSSPDGNAGSKEAPRSRHHKSYTSIFADKASPKLRLTGRTHSHELPRMFTNPISKGASRRFHFGADKSVHSSLPRTSARLEMKKHLTVQGEPNDSALIGPYQAILHTRQQSRAGKARPLMCIEHEAATVMNNLAVLLRWNQGAAEAEALFGQALRLLSEPTHSSQAHRSSSVSHPQRDSRFFKAASTLTPQLSKLSSFISNVFVPEPAHAPTHGATGNGGNAEGWEGDATDSQAASAPCHDSRVSHLKAMVLSNLGGLLGSQGRYIEAMSTYKQALQQCDGFNRPVDAMIIAINLINIYRRLEAYQPALSLARANVEPQLGINFGVHTHRATHHRPFGRADPEAAPHWGYDPMNPANRPYGRGYRHLHERGSQNNALSKERLADYKMQLLHGLASCVTDDGASALYLWASQQLANHERAEAEAWRAQVRQSAALQPVVQPPSQPHTSVQAQAQQQQTSSQPQTSVQAQAQQQQPPSQPQTSVQAQAQQQQTPSQPQTSVQAQAQQQQTPSQPQTSVQAQVHPQQQQPLSQPQPSVQAQVQQQQSQQTQQAQQEQQAQQAQQEHPTTPQPHDVALPETLFLLQIPGVHLQCIHMLRWLLVVPAEEQGGCACPEPMLHPTAPPAEPQLSEHDATQSNALPRPVARTSMWPTRARTSAPHLSCQNSKENL